MSGTCKTKNFLGFSLKLKLIMIRARGGLKNDIKNKRRVRVRDGYAVELRLDCLLVRSWEFLSCIGVVAQPWRQAEKLVLSSRSCVAPLRLGGLRGKQSTPSVWMGGTGVVSTVSEREWHGVRTTLEDGIEATVWF
jgi:hypothetical protein